MVLIGAWAAGPGHHCAASARAAGKMMTGEWSTARPRDDQAMAIPCAGRSGSSPVEPGGFPDIRRGELRSPFCLTKNPAAFATGLVSCGAGRDRTAVQTTGQWAFYMLSRFIGCRSMPGEGHPSKDLGPVSCLRSGPPRRPVFQGDTPGPGRRMTGLPEGYSSTLLLFTWIKPIALGY
jgi:hypothetical protein